MFGSCVPTIDLLVPLSRPPVMRLSCFFVLVDDKLWMKREFLNRGDTATSARSTTGIGQCDDSSRSPAHVRASLVLVSVEWLAFRDLWLRRWLTTFDPFSSRLLSACCVAEMSRLTLCFLWMFLCLTFEAESTNCDPPPQPRDTARLESLHNERESCVAPRKSRELSRELYHSLLPIGAHQVFVRPLPYFHSVESLRFVRMCLP